MELYKKLLYLESHLSQKETARRLGVTERTLRNWKNLKTQPTPEQVKKINRIYGANRRRMSEKTITRTEKKIKKREQTPIRISAADFSRSITDPSVRSQFLMRYGSYTGFYTIQNPSACQFMITPTPYGKPAGRCGVELITVMTFQTESALENFRERHDGAEFGGFLYTHTHIEQEKNPLELYEAIERYEAKAFTMKRRQKKRTDIVVRFLGYVIV